MILVAHHSARSISCFALASALASSLITRSAASSSECTVAARLRGESELVGSIEDALRRREVSVGQSTGACDAPSIAVAVHANGLTLRRETKDGSSEEVNVSNLSFAVLLIESWVKSDLDRALASTLSRSHSTPPLAAASSTLDAAHAPVASSGASSSVSLPSSDADLVGTRDAHAGPDARALLGARTLFLGARGEAGVSGDGAPWWGGLARIGLARGAFAGWTPWIGVRGALSPSHRIEGSGTSTARSEIAGLLGMDHPLAFGDFALTPGVAIGAAWFESRRVVPEVSACVAEGTCAWEGGPIVLDGFKERHVGARTDLSIAAGHRISPDLAIHVSFILSLAPFSPGAPIIPSYARDLPEVERAKIALEPEPRIIARGSLSIEWGAP